MNFEGLSQEFITSCPVLDAKYKLLFTLGKGRYAKVYLAVHMSSLQRIAVKVLHCGLDQQQVFLRQMGMMIRGAHQSVIQIYDAGLCSQLKKPGKTIKYVNYIVMPLAQRGQLFKLLSDSGKLSQDLARIFFIKLIRAMLYLNQQKIAHRDIKTQNILVWPDFSLKLADFGFATDLQPTHPFSKDDQKVGSLSYNAPQQIQGMAQVNLELIDVFSAGVVLFEMIFNSSPFQYASTDDKYYRLLKRKDKGAFWNIFNDIHKLSKECKNLLQRMLQHDPGCRISLQQIIQHPWITAQSNMLQINKQLSLKMQFMLQVFKEEQEVAYARKAANRKNQATFQRRPSSPPQITKTIRVRFQDLKQIINKSKTILGKQLLQ